jgi:hypothetical protein
MTGLITRKQASLLAEHAERKIHLLRGCRVMLDRDLAEFYGVETGALNRAVRRNVTRFPADFMFQLKAKEEEDLRCQFGISNPERGGRRYLPYAFTQEGVAMLSSVLRSPRAVAVNVSIMRAFVRMRSILAEHQDLKRRIDDLELRYDAEFKAVFDAIRRVVQPLMAPAKRRRIGFPPT